MRNLVGFRVALAILCGTPSNDRHTRYMAEGSVCRSAQLRSLLAFFFLSFVPVVVERSRGSGRCCLVGVDLDGLSDAGREWLVYQRCLRMETTPQEKEGVCKEFDWLSQRWVAQPRVVVGLVEFAGRDSGEGGQLKGS